MERLTENVLGNIQLKACENDFCKETCAEHDEEKNCDNCPIQKAFEKLAEYEDLDEQGKLLKLPCAVGDTVYYRYDGIKIAPMCVEQIIIAEYGINLLLEYCGNDEKLKYWKINIESTAIDCKVVFLTRPEAERALAEMEGKK